jgi:hypothetical protein
MNVQHNRKTNAIDSAVKRVANAQLISMAICKTMLVRSTMGSVYTSKAREKL